MIYKILGSTSGFILGYGWSYYNNYNKYKRSVPSKVHILPSIMSCIIGYYVPSVPIFAGSFILGLYALIEYNDWEKRVINESIKKS